MQDSIEDYIRITRNCKEGPTGVKNEALITAQIKKECDAKAMQILQFAIEGRMRSDALFRCLPYINQAHYQDIVEERAISKLCGYPLCSRRIPDMPKKQFYISTKNNKVYDITDRKNYCSNFCYRASLHVKDQIDTSPIWLRKYNEKLNFTLLNKSEKGLPGEVVDQGVTKPMEPLFTSVSAFTEMSLDEAEELEMNPEEEEKQKKKQLKKPKKFQKSTMKTINENEEESEDIMEANPPKTVTENTAKVKEKKEEVKLKKKSAASDTESHIRKCFNEWLTLETYIFIFGEEEVKEKLDSEKLSHYFDTLKVAELQVDQQKRYIDICRKLHLKELAEEKFDQAIVGGNHLSPIPDYQSLKEENKELNLKVKSFYLGELHVKDDPNFPQKKKQVEEEEEEHAPAVLPMVDVSSQNAIRRKIFLNSLNKTIQSLFQTLKISPSLVLSDLQALVKTFKLKADNIVFKPAVWTYIAVILLNILALKHEDLRSILDSDDRGRLFDLWFSSLPHRKQIIDDTLKLLQDIDRFVEEYICK